ncbi:lysozyme [Paucibacter sp. APW11]|uniref:Lysozyme n=1 Tax=Roseateles aquae TaxID=3077235 RepID=A0ABU3P6Y4_9BURK|nr:lysozyme [Paucibacter sp. APW11]MDT8998337.1 lysozyme [Paucibacter sp. APW11]
MSAGQRVAVGTGVSALVLALVMPLIMQSEGRSLKPYRDVGGVWTVCDGDTKNVEQRRYSPAECDQRLASNLYEHDADMRACLSVQLAPHVEAAMLSFTYNVGAKNFCGSTLRKRLEAGDVPAACAELSRWVYVAGKDCRDPANHCPGIVNRRARERALCEGRSSS